MYLAFSVPFINFFTKVQRTQLKNACMNRHPKLVSESHYSISLKKSFIDTL